MYNESLELTAPQHTAVNRKRWLPDLVLILGPLAWFLLLAG
jgi:hypothetical protein